MAQSTRNQQTKDGQPKTITGRFDQRLGKLTQLPQLPTVAEVLLHNSYEG